MEDRTKKYSVEINSSMRINASKTSIFNVISNHEGTPTWIDDVASVKLIKDGKPKNGFGAIREVNFKPKLWSTIQEKIIFYIPNQEYHYQIIKMGGVVDHLGVWKLSESENGETIVAWNVYMRYKRFHFIRLIINKFAKDFKLLQEEALLKLKQNLEERG